MGSEGTTGLSLIVSCGDYKQTLDLLNGLKGGIGATATDGNDTVYKVSTVDMDTRSHTRVAVKIFHTLAEEGISIQMISTSEIEVSVSTDEKHMEPATRVLYKALGLGK